MQQRDFSRLFSSPLQDVQRASLYRSLGLHLFRFMFLETCGGSVLRATLPEGKDSLPTIELPESIERWAAEAKKQNAALLVLEYPLDKPAIRSLQHEKTLWEELFPYPFSQLAFLGADRYWPTVSVQPVEIEAAIEGLAVAVGVLEREIAKSEVSCLFVRSPLDELCLAFHYVRGKRVWAGDYGSERFLSLAARYKQGTLTQQMLREELGPQAFFVYVERTHYCSVDNIEIIRSLANDISNAAISNGVRANPNSCSVSLPASFRNDRL
ncbi:MAG: hypothetical protein HY537_11050 [Deltaproteobacteria bacterium]|nr:hypothetical protein [Deltaproteobacteria bacterium]